MRNEYTSAKYDCNREPKRLCFFCWRPPRSCRPSRTIARPRRGWRGPATTARSNGRRCLRRSPRGPRKSTRRGAASARAYLPWPKKFNASTRSWSAPENRRSRWSARWSINPRPSRLPPSSFQLTVFRRIPPFFLLLTSPQLIRSVEQKVVWSVRPLLFSATCTTARQRIGHRS